MLSAAGVFETDAEADDDGDRTPGGGAVAEAAVAAPPSSCAAPPAAQAGRSPPAAADDPNAAVTAAAAADGVPSHFPSDWIPEPADAGDANGAAEGAAVAAGDAPATSATPAAPSQTAAKKGKRQARGAATGGGGGGAPAAVDAAAAVRSALARPVPRPLVTRRVSPDTPRLSGPCQASASNSRRVWPATRTPAPRMDGADLGPLTGACRTSPGTCSVLVSLWWLRTAMSSCFRVATATCTRLRSRSRLLMPSTGHRSSWSV